MTKGAAGGRPKPGGGPKPNGWPNSSGRPKRSGRPNSSGRPAARLELDVHDLASTGEGIGRDGTGAAVFVRGALPGERVLASLNERARSPLRANLLRVLHASEARVAPPCAHADRCGGCDLMHLEPSTRRSWLERMLLEQLARSLRSVATLPAPTWHTPTQALGYRSRARLRIEADGKRARVGFSEAMSHRTVAVESCVVLDDALRPALAELAALFAACRGAGEARVALGAGGRRVYDVEFDGELDGALLGRIEQAREHIAGAEVRLSGATAPLSVGEARCVSIAADGLPLLAPSGGFAQASAVGGAALARAVAEGAGDAERAVELFAGSGALTVLLARHVGSLVAVEADRDAATSLADNLHARGLFAVKVRVEDANAFAFARNLPLVVLDPPRAGAPGAVRNIAAARARRVVYVSCNAATLGRDLAVLAGAGYDIDTLALFDLFPQTSHLETVAVLSPRAHAAKGRDGAQ